MFVQAIEIASKYTRPIRSIMRYYGSKSVIKGAATLFFVNDEGWALTCRHVTQVILAAVKINEKYNNFRNELVNQSNSKKPKSKKAVEDMYKYTKDSPIELRNRFMDCIEGDLKFNIIESNKYDISLIKFFDYSRLLCDSFPVFPIDTTGLKQGKFLCRLGFPFPEFTDFAYDEENDQIMWTSTGKVSSPRFPIEGMVTRHLLGDQGKLVGFEMSTPGLRGQSGGPVFDADGKVWGMQSQTAHLDLDFDVDQEVIRKGHKTRVKDSAFLHVGHCIHVDVIKSFMRENGVNFREE